jgi:Flp pilus assembly protein TadD
VKGDERFLTALQGRVMKSRVCVAVLLLAGSTAAQLDAGSIVKRLQVQVAFANGFCDRSTHVRLMGLTGPIADVNVNDRCEAGFSNIPIGTYHMSVSGLNFSDIDEVVSLSSASSEIEVKVKRADAADGAVPGRLFVSAADLAIPRNAKKEFARASELVAKQDFAHAIEKFNKAIVLYPDFAGAYNSLGVIYSQLGDNTQAAAALQKAINLDDHFALAYMNLGLLNLSTGDFSSAENVLNKASSFDPANTTTLTALSYAEFMDHHLGEAITASQKAHELPGEHSFVHQVAARAYEQQHDAGSAIKELELFLKEEPTGSRADIARKELTAVRAIPP